MVRPMRLLIPLFAFLLCVGLVGCDAGRSGVDVDFSDPLESKLSALKDSGQSARLTDLTDFGWDEVHVFNEGAARERIEQVVGTPVITGNFWDSASTLLVFERGQSVVRAIAVTGDYLRSDRPTWATRVQVVPWGNGALRLTDGG